VAAKEPRELPALLQSLSARTASLSAMLQQSEAAQQVRNTPTSQGLAPTPPAWHQAVQVQMKAKPI